MKKLLFIFSMLVLPLMVKADMGAPQIKTYTAEVTSGSGAVCYEYNYSNQTLTSKVTIPSKENITIIYEETYNDVLYGEVNYNNYSCYVKLSDIVNTSSEVTTSDNNVYALAGGYNGADYYASAYVLADTLEVHSGPAEGYSVLSTLKKGEKINVTHYYEGSAWYYIENVGWVNGLNGTIGFKHDSDVLTLREVNVYDKVAGGLYSEGNASIIKTLKKDTKISGYYSLDVWSMGYYIETDDYKGYISYEDVAFKVNYQIHLFEDMYAFTDFASAQDYDYNEVNNSTVTISKDSEIQVNYEYQYPISVGNSTYYQVIYNNKTYWVVDLVGEDAKYAVVYKTTAVVNKDVNVTKEYISDDSIGTLKQGETVDVLYELYNYYYYIKTDTLEGWVRDYDGALEIKELDIEEVEQPEEETKETNEEEEVIKVETKESSNIYVYIGIALAIGLMAIVIVIIINKKRKNK